LAGKVDTQGAEPLVLAGGEGTLSRAGLVILEFWPFGMRRMGGSPDEVIAFAARHFPLGIIVRDGQHAEEPRPVRALVPELRDLVATAGENRFVDLVLLAHPLPEAAAIGQRTRRRRTPGRAKCWRLGGRAGSRSHPLAGAVRTALPLER
jgi:hypothetical protein